MKSKTRAFTKQTFFLFCFLIYQGFLYGHGSHGVSGNVHTHGNLNLVFLTHYSGDFTDSDNDGMTDIAESRYGYNPNSSQSFPEDDFVVDAIQDDSESFPIESYEFADLVIVRTEGGITLKWTEEDNGQSWPRFTLALNAGNKVIYYGGHGWDSAEVNYSSFSLSGNEVLVGRLSEFDPSNGNFIRDYPDFTINLSDFPVKQIVFGAEDNEIKFKFTNFTNEQQEKYVDFMRRVIPILNDVLGVPSESFTCEFIMQTEEGTSWVTMNHGREIYLDANWNSRLLVHEMVHVWEGKLGFSWSGPDREYSDDLSAFAEVAEGIAYKVLHDYVMAYPNHYVSRDTATGGAWNNWSSEAWSYDLYKHQRFTGGGAYWTGDLRAVNHRYSLSAMLIQIILVENPDFIKNMRSDLFDIVNADNHILTREEIVNLWASNIETINGIDTKTYLTAMPVFNGKKLDQGFYPIVNIRNENDVDVFSSYSTDGMFWWHFIVPDDSSDVDEYGSIPISSLNLPEWVNYNYNPNDGYYYLDTNDMPYTLSVQNVYGEEIKSFDLRSDNTYQDEEKIIPNTLGEVRVSENNDVAPNKFTQGLYRYNLTYTDIIQYTNEASEDFYFMGEQNLYQNEDEILIMVGVDSMFTEKINVTNENFSLDLEVINGCGILKTSDIPLNEEMMLTITVSSHDEQHTYKRALVHAGNSWGAYRQQLLIMDRDFDGVEDLYDNDLSESDIQTRYATYREKYPKASLLYNEGSTSNGNEDGTGNEHNSTGGSGSESANYEKEDENETSSITIDLSKIEKSESTNSLQKGSEDEEETIANDSTSSHFLVEDLGNGWKKSNWFGSFFETSSPWDYHFELGWIYIVVDSNESVWFWHEKIGWCWSSQTCYPFVFQDGKDWLYFDFTNSSDVNVYDYSARKWSEF